MQRSRYLGRGQIAVCMRSGIKCHASELVRDGRIPSLLVLPEWADPPQPQERPYVPNDMEGTPRFDVSPDITPTIPPVLEGGSGTPTAPVLSVDAQETPIGAILTWTASVPVDGDSIEGYDLYRSEDGGAFSLLAATDADVLTYTDEDVNEGSEYEYYVIGNGAEGGPSAQSNHVLIEFEIVSDVFLTDHTIVATGGSGSGAQEPQIAIYLGADSIFPLGDLYIGGGGDLGGLVVDGTPAGPDPISYKFWGLLVDDEWWRGASPPVGADYECRLTVLSGDAPEFGSAVNSWLSMAVDNGWEWGGVFGTPRSGVWRIEIRDTATLTVLATGDMTVSQELL
jgi:hypothetical protein